MDLSCHCRLFWPSLGFQLILVAVTSPALLCLLRGCGSASLACEAIALPALHAPGSRLASLRTAAHCCHDNVTAHQMGV